jgi:hypothetical protein
MIDLDLPDVGLIEDDEHLDVAFVSLLEDRADGASELVRPIARWHDDRDRRHLRRLSVGNQPFPCRFHRRSFER